MEVLSSPEPEAMRAITLGAWLGLVARRGLEDEHVWLVLQDAARAALSAVRRRLRPGEDEELVAEVVALAPTKVDAWRRAELAGVQLARWLAGVMKRRLHTLRRDELAVAADLEHVPARDPAEPHRAHPDGPDGAESAEPSMLRGRDPTSLLTPKQIAVWTIACSGVGSRRGAQELGITRDAYRDRLRRAKERIRAGVPARSPRDPGERARLAKHVAQGGDATNAMLLVLRGGGATYAACAHPPRLTVEAVRSRLRRVWRVWRTSLRPSGGDTGLPCPALPSEGRESSPPGGGPLDRDTRASVAGRRPVRNAEPAKC